jgi:hypothetical protein
MVLTQVQLQRRKPLWTALSYLWLDTEIAPYHIRRIADAAIASGYGLTELNEIYLYEVTPVVYLNLLVPAGAWQCFDEEWLHAEARKRAENRSPWVRFWIWTGFGRKLMTYATDEHWDEIIALVQAQANHS